MKMRELTAYHITLRAYGTWLHGDERGSVDKANSRFGDPVLEPQRGYEKAMRGAMTSKPFRFNKSQRQLLEAAIEEVTKYRNWHLAALAVRTNHIHIVVGAEATPEKVAGDFKSYGTRALRRAGLPHEQNVWSEHGSNTYLFDALSYEAAVNYVLEQQGEGLDDLD
ncbi:hypothetical protein EON80_16255 [bacterium]|nr:MAG: hypothetical protein EON80_16255 [bacterium]